MSSHVQVFERLCQWFFHSQACTHHQQRQLIIRPPRFNIQHRNHHFWMKYKLHSLNQHAMIYGLLQFCRALRSNATDVCCKFWLRYISVVRQFITIFFAQSDKLFGIRRWQTNRNRFSHAFKTWQRYESAFSNVTAFYVYINCVYNQLSYSCIYHVIYLYSFRLALLWYHTIVRPFFGLDSPNTNKSGVQMAKQLILESQQEFQHSALFLFFSGRVKRLEVCTWLQFTSIHNSCYIYLNKLSYNRSRFLISQLSCLASLILTELWKRTNKPCICLNKGRSNYFAYTKLLGVIWFVLIMTRHTTPLADSSTSRVGRSCFMRIYQLVFLIYLLIYTSKNFQKW